MRIRNIFVASLLTMTFGCPGDDTGDTDANTTVNATDNTTPGTTTTGDDTTTTPPGTDSTTTGGGAETTTGGGAETTTGGGAETTTGGAETTTGGVVNEACEQFCNDYFAVCGDSGANDYGSTRDCVLVCADYDQKVFECKEYHASMADGPDSVHCGHANLDGGGVC